MAATNMLIFKNAGLLEAYTPKGIERVQPLFRDKANPPSWVGIDVFMSAFCFNTEVAKKHTLPAPPSWADLTPPSRHAPSPLTSRSAPCPSAPSSVRRNAPRPR